jgi:Uma2 family endonuclease
MATTTLVPFEEYLRTSYRPDCEWVDGEVRERYVGEGQHSVIQKFLIMYLGAREQEWKILVLPEQRVQTSASHLRIPDVCAVREEAPFEAIVTVAPLLCIELASRDDRMTEMYEKVQDYLQMGVRTVWIIDPRLRLVFSTDTGGAIQQVSDVLMVSDTLIAIQVSDLFRELNRLEKRG